MAGTPVTRLDEWLAAHGPLSAPVALALAIRVCARAAAMDDAELTASLPSLRTGGIGREDGAGWAWMPERTAQARRAVRDESVIEAVGALLAECVTGQRLAHRLAGGDAVIAWVRARRPDLSPAVSEVVAHAMAARGGAGASMAAFAGELRTALGTAPRKARAGRRLALAGTVGALAVLTAAGVYAARGGWQDAPLGPDGLTGDEATAFAVVTESTDLLAIIDEHTAAIQELAELERLWLSRVSIADPRLAWLRARQAWVRQLAGDGLTAEQLLEPLPPQLDAALGRSHPYARAVRLELADVFDARGSREAAAALRAEADQGTAELLGEPASAIAASPDVPWPPYVVAHVAPNKPAREGFRQDAASGAFFMPLTSTQRLLAGRNGWRLRMRAEAACRVSLVAGADPRGIEITAERNAGGDWAVRVDGVVPAIALRANAGPTVDLALAADAGGAVRAHVEAGADAVARIDSRCACADPALLAEGVGGPRQKRLRDRVVGDRGPLGRRAHLRTGGTPLASICAVTRSNDWACVQPFSRSRRYSRVQTTSPSASTPFGNAARPSVFAYFDSGHLGNSSVSSRGGKFLAAPHGSPVESPALLPDEP